MKEPRKAQRRGRPSECISRFGVFWGEEIRRAYARGGEELARDRRDLAVGPDASEERVCEGVYFNHVASGPARLRKKGTRMRVSGQPPAALPCPCSCVRRHERERPQGPAGHRPEVPASGRSASSALSSAGESVQALHHVKISPIRILVECAGKALRQRAKPFRAAPWKSFL